MRYLLCCILLLSACHTPSPEFRGLPATRVTVDGSTFDVRVNGAQAEALRVNAQYAPRFGPIKHRAESAMGQVSGCKVVKVSGDQALAFGLLKCGKRAPVVKRKPRDLECIPQRGSAVKDGFGGVTVDVDCYPI